VNIVAQSSRFAKQKIKNIYVINLERDLQRWNTFIGRLKPSFCFLQGKSLIRFLAVDGSQPDILTRTIEHTFEENEPEMKIAKNFATQHPGSVGCYLSHLTLWSMLAQESKDEFVLIMEDDAFFLPHAPQNIEIALNQSQKHNWDILYVGHNNLRGSLVHPLFLRPRHSRPGEPVSGINTGFFGYVVRVSSLPKMVRLVRKFQTPYVDLSVRDLFGEGQNKISALFLSESLIQHTNVNTSRREFFDANMRK